MVIFDCVRMKLRRVELGISQDEVATQTGISQGLYSAIELGRRVPRVNDACAIAKVLKLDFSDLLKDGENPRKARTVARVRRGSSGVSAA